MKAQAWMVHFRGAAYANGPIRFRQPVSERELREWVRNWLGVKRLPAGTEVWNVRN